MIIRSLDQSYTEGIREFYPKNFCRQDAKIPQFHPVVLVRGPTILFKLLLVTPNNAEMGTLTDVVGPSYSTPKLNDGC